MPQNEENNKIISQEEVSNFETKDVEKKGLNIDTTAIREALLNFVFPLISLVVSVVLIVLFVYPTIKDYPEVKAELDQKNILKDTLQKKIGNLKKLVDFKEFVEEDSDLVSKVIVSEAEVPKLLDQIHQIATNSGMTVDRLSYSYGGGDQTGASYNTVIVSLGAETNYEQIVLFMESVEDAARFVSAPSFRYSSSRSAEGDNRLSANFSVESPYLFVQSNAVTDEPVNLDVSSQEFVDFVNMIKGLRYYEFLNIDVEAVEETAEEEITGEASGVIEGTPEENPPAEETPPVTE